MEFLEFKTEVEKLGYIVVKDPFYTHVYDVEGYRLAIISNTIVKHMNTFYNFENVGSVEDREKMFSLCFKYTSTRITDRCVDNGLYYLELNNKGWFEGIHGSLYITFDEKDKKYSITDNYYKKSFFTRISAEKIKENYKDLSNFYITIKEVK